MKFQNISSPKPVVDYLVNTLIAKLTAGQHVLWLVPGGSAITIAAQVTEHLRHQTLPLNHLAVTLTDERYGPVGHPDSNWLQLQQAGFELPGSHLLPVLANTSLEATTQAFADTLATELDRANYRLGLFGIGPDGHTAGILPHAPATTATSLAAGYNGGKFQRITITAPAIARLDEAVVYAAGQAKWPILHQLATENLTLDQQPAVALKQIPAVTIFHDYQGDLS